MKRLLCVILVIAMVTAYTVPVYAVDDAKVTFEQVDNDKVSATLTDREPVELPDEESPYADKDVVRVSIFLEKAGTIEAGFSTMNIARNSAAMNYRSRVERDQTSVTKKIEKAIKDDLDVVWNLTLASNLISANVQYGQIETIENVPGVERVVIETRYEPDVVSTGAADPNMGTSGVQIGTSAVWSAGYTGAGSTIAIIDTGADIEHQAFDSAAFDYSLSLLDEEVDLMDASDIAGVLTELNAYNRTGFSAEDLYVNTKIPFGFNYIDEDLDIVHVNDEQGEHGSHVAGIATANAYVNNGDGTFSYALDTTRVQGVAPDAQLLVMKVFGKDGGAYDSDYMAAIEDAIILGADSVNLSLGSGNPGMSSTTSYNEELGAFQDIMDNLEKCGVVVAMSAGNSGYWAEHAEYGLPYLFLDDVSFQTDGEPGSFTNSFAVASVDNDGFTAAYFDVAGNIVSYSDNPDYGNAPMTTLGGTQEYVFVNTIGLPEDFAAVGSEVLAGKIVMCYRGETSFYEKANAAVEAGAIGVVIVNNDSGVINLNLTGYLHTAPVVSILQTDGEYFKAAGTENTTESGITYWTGSMEISEGIGIGQYNSEYYTMSSFSSWGVPGSLELKPEITAPGGSIYSVAGANYYDGEMLFADHESYEVMSGTSMASPQVAGMAALMAQYIRETGLAEKTGLDERTLIQSLLMSTAVPLRDGNSGGNYYPVIQQGAGLANVGAAAIADSYILMDSEATVTYNDGKVKAELGDDPEKTGVYSFSFTINNLTDVEKSFALSADVFTQDAFGYAGYLFLDTWTTNLTPDVSWAVNGKAVESGEELEGLDFNGDGVVNTADGQILLDYATGLDVTLYNTDKADLNGDGVINSYDSYLFFTMVNNGGAVVPANGSAEVTVTITLSDDDKAWLANYVNGAYIEAYVYAESLSTAEGVEGTTHSIPMLAFYGNWSDASMYDKVSAIEYLYGLDNDLPYLLETNGSAGKLNGLMVKYSDMNGEYWFGGNPMVNDETYMPERNAISAARGDKISKINFTAIRNAADSYFQVVDAETGEAYVSDQTGAVMSAYYYVNGSAWNNTYYKLNAGFTPDGIAENTAIEVGMTLIPEYYVDRAGNVDWDALGSGVTYSMPMVVDNTAPVLNDADIDLDENALVIETTDNQYIAAVALYDIYGQYLYTYSGSNPDQAAGDTVEFSLPLADVNGPSFLLQVYDYAMNTTTYEIHYQIGDVTDEVESIELDKTALTMQKGDTDILTAFVAPVNATNRAVVWSSSDESVVTVDENGNLTAVEVGSATITATAVANEALTATCAVTVIDITAQLNGIVWDEDGSIWFSEFAVNDLPNYTKLSPDMLEEDYFVSAAVGADGTLYASTLNTSTLSGSIYTIDPVTYEATLLTDCAVGSTPVFYSDLTYVPAMFGTGVLLGTYGPYVIAIDPATGEAMGVVDELDSNLVGIAACYGQYDPESGVYRDVVYLIQNDGTIVQELYYGYEGMVVPYMYYFMGMRASFDSGVDVGDALYFNSAYYDGSYLYWSAFERGNDDAVTLYAIDADFTESVYNMGQFPQDVWPVGGLYQMTASNDADAAKFADILADNSVREITASEIELVPQEIPVYEGKASGSLNAVTGATTAPVRPMSDAVVGQTYTVTVTVTAKDVEGAAIDSTNGVSTVTYDNEILTLTGVKVEGDYTAVNPADVADADGSVTFGYVALEGIAADDVVATLTFEVKAEEQTAITVIHEEVNDQDSGYVEELNVDFVCDHEYVFVDFEVAEDYSWAKAIFACTGCGDEIEYDAEIESEFTYESCQDRSTIRYTVSYGEHYKYFYESVLPLGHDWIILGFKWNEDYTYCLLDRECARCGERVQEELEITAEITEPTCVTDGKAVYTATYDVEIYDVVEVILPATGHVWGEPAFTWNEDNTACTVTYTCEVCDETVSVEAVVTVETTEATCEEDGKITYTATYGDDSDVVELTIPATGHNYENGSCTECGEEDPDYVAPTKKPGSGKPDTGDASSPVWFVLVMVCVAGIGVLLTARKKWIV